MIHLIRPILFVYILILISGILVYPQTEKILKVTAVGKSSPKITQPAKARAMALRAAQVEGYRKLAQAAGLEKVFQLDSQPGHRPNSPPGHRVSQPGHRVKIEAFMKGARVVGKRIISDHEVEITMEIEASKIFDMASKIKKSTHTPQKQEEESQ